MKDPIRTMLRKRCAHCGHTRGAHFGSSGVECLHRNADNTDRCDCFRFALSEQVWVATLPDIMHPDLRVRRVTVRQHPANFDDDPRQWTACLDGLSVVGLGRTALQARDAALRMQVDQWQLVEPTPTTVPPTRAVLRAALRAAERCIVADASDWNVPGRQQPALAQIRAALKRTPS